jgi:hypothetical protein
MQTASAASQLWQWLTEHFPSFGAGALVVAAGYKLFLERKKPEADIHETEARAKLAEADARNKDADTRNRDADTMSEVFETLRLAHKSFDLESKERREVSEKLEACERNVRSLMARTEQLEKTNKQLGEEVRGYKKLLKLD